MASPRGVNTVWRRRIRQSKSSSNSSGSSGRVRSSNATAVAAAAAAASATTPSPTTTTTATTATNTDNSEHGGTRSNNNNINKHDQITAGHSHRDTAAVPRGRDCTALEISTWKCQQDPSCGTGGSRQERAKVGDASPPAQLQTNGACDTSYSSSIVFVRSKQWGVRHPNRTDSFRIAPAEDGVLRAHQLHVSGGKRQRPFVANESSTCGRAARRRSASTEAFQRQRTYDTAGRNEGKTGNIGGDDRNRPLELSTFSASADGAGQGQGQGQGPTKREKAVKTPSDTSTSLVSPSAAASPERPSRSSPPIRWRIVPPPSGSKLRPGSRRWLHRGRSPCWSASTAGAEKLQLSRDIEPPVAAKIESGTSASVASVVTPERRVPQPLSVVAVWARTSSLRWAARNTEATSRAGGRYSKTMGVRVGRACEGLQDPQVATATECAQIGRTMGTTSR